MSSSLRRLFAPSYDQVPPVRVCGSLWAAIAVVVAFCASIFVWDLVVPHGPWAALGIESLLIVAIGGLTLVLARRLPPAPVHLEPRVRTRWIVGGAAAVVTTAAIVGGIFHLVLPDEMHGIGHKIPSGAEGRVVAIVAMALLAPIIEETVFRGWLMRSLTTKVPAFWAVAISGTVFGLLHIWLARYSFGMGLEIVAVGWTLGFLCLHSGSLAPNIAGHMALNLNASVSSIFKPFGAFGAVLVVVAVVVAVRWLLAHRAKAQRGEPVAA